MHKQGLAFGVLAVLASTLTLAASASVASASTWDNGDVFAGYSNSTYDVFSNGGAFKENVSNGLGGFSTGCSFNSQGNLYTTAVSSSGINVLDGNHPHSVIQTINAAADGLGAAESVVFAANGEFFAGGPSTPAILRYNAAGVFQQSYPVTGGQRVARTSSSCRRIRRPCSTRARDQT